MRKGSISLIALLLAAILLASYTVAGFYGVPYLIHSKLPTLLAGHFSLAADFGQITFNPYSFKLQLSSITLDSDRQQGPEPLLRLEALTADIEPFPLLRGELIAKSLQLDSFAVNIRRDDDGQYNIPFAAPIIGGKGTPLTIGAFPLRFSLNNITFSNGTLTFDDKPNGTTHLVEKIEASLPSLSNVTFQAEEYIHPRFSAIINGSPIELTGQAALSGNSLDTNSSLKTELSCSFNGIDLQRYFSYLPLQLPFALENGKAQGSLKFTFAQSKAANIFSVDFNMHARDVAVATGDNSFSLSAPSVKLDGTIHPLTGNTHLKNLELREPRAEVSSAFTFAHFTSLARLASAKTGKQSTPEVRIDLLLADNGTISVTRGKDHPAITWHSLQLRLSDYSNTLPKGRAPDKQATFRLSGEQENTRSTFNFQGNIDDHLLPKGSLLLNNYAAADIFPLIALPGAIAQAGLVDAQATISFSDFPNIDGASRIDISEAVLSFTDLALVDGEHVWFSAPAIKIAGLSKKGKKVSLGSAYLRNSSFDLQVDKLPPVMQKIGGEKGNIAIDALEFSGAITIANSSGAQPPLKFTDVSLQAINLARLESSSERDNLTFSARLGKSGEVQAKGKVRLNSFITNLTVGFAGLDGRTILPWFGNTPIIADVETVLSGKGAFSFPFVSYSGQLLLQDGALTKQDKKKKPIPYLAWKEINLEDFRFTRNPLHLGATKCTLLAPEFSLAVTPKTPNLAARLAAFVQQVFPFRPDEKQTSSLAPLEVQEIQISQGRIPFVDSRFKPERKGEISQFSGTVSNLDFSAKNTPANYAFSGNLDELPFQLEGNVQLSNQIKQGNAKFTLNDFPLALVSQYFKKEVDIVPDRGSISVAATTTWGNGMLSRRADLLLAGIAPRTETSDTALPLALMNGEDDQFSLQVSSEHTFADPLPPLLPETVKAFKKQLLKAAVSPILLASEQFHSLMGQEFAQFEPGKILLSGKGQESLARFVNLLTAHPALGLTITGSADVNIDGEVMLRNLEEQELLRVEKENIQRAAALEAAIADYKQKQAEKLKAAGKSEEIFDLKVPKQILDKYTPLKPVAVKIDKTMLQELAKERARIVHELMIESLSVAPERITPAKRVHINNDAKMEGNSVLFTITSYAPSRK